MDVVAAAFESEPDADQALHELTARLGLSSGSLEKGRLGYDGVHVNDRFVVAGPIPTSMVVQAGSIIRRHRGRIVAQVAGRRA